MVVYVGSVLCVGGACLLLLGERVSLAFGGIDGLSKLHMLLFLAFRVQLENLKFQEKSQKTLYS
jgi:hypothetical protein